MGKLEGHLLHLSVLTSHTKPLFASQAGIKAFKTDALTVELQGRVCILPQKNKTSTTSCQKESAKPNKSQLQQQDLLK